MSSVRKVVVTALFVAAKAGRMGDNDFPQQPMMDDSMGGQMGQMDGAEMDGTEMEGAGGSDNYGGDVDGNADESGSSAIAGEMAAESASEEGAMGDGMSDMAAAEEGGSAPGWMDQMGARMGAMMKPAPPPMNPVDRLEKRIAAIQKWMSGFKGRLAEKEPKNEGKGKGKGKDGKGKDGKTELPP